MTDTKRGCRFRLKLTEVIARLGALLLALLPLPALAQSNPDIDAAARSVVRVVVTGEDGEGGRGIGMGSGVAITPTRIVTNAHVVESAAESDGFVGIVPSEGRKRYEGRVVAYSAALDLAVIAISDGRIEPATLYGGVLPDGAVVAALGYPFGVDRAMAAGLEDVIRPQSPVKTLGNIGGRRTNARYDTVLHDANIGRGNSGGPLVDTCGRVVGINSFLSVSEGIDSPFAFALSVKELSAFLAKAKIAPTIVTTPCLTGDAAAARAAALEREEADAAAREARRGDGDAAKVATEKQRIRDAIDGERDNALALAALMLVLGGVAASAGMTLLGKRERWAQAAFAGGALLAVGAAVVFLARPKMSDADDRWARANPVKPASVTDAVNGDGTKLCRLNEARSRVTVSKTDDVPLDWRADGCVNGRTQYGANAGAWSRTFVPNGEATVTVQRYDPAKARYSVERFLMGAEAMDAARAVRARYKDTSCSTDPAQQRAVADMEAAVRATLPTTPNERLVYDCGAAPPTP
jgi:serine protease Do